MPNSMQQPLAPCVCGALRRWAIDPAFTSCFTVRAGVSYFKLNDKMEVKICFCPLCGGHLPEQNNFDCTCGALSSWSSYAQSTIGYDSDCNEYYCRDSEGGHNNLYFCPNCGGQLPKSKRSAFFLQPSPDEIGRLRNLLKDVKCIRDVIVLLGPPDLQKEGTRRSARDKLVFKAKDTKMQVSYTRLAQTIDLVVQEDEDGRLAVLYVPKPRIEPCSTS
jgi:hypothetical protein